MNPTRKGKIARLPLHVRELLNKRLQDGEKGRSLVKWLNVLPEVRGVSAAEFGGRPINEQNLTEWKQGGYRDWLALQEARDFIPLLQEGTACGDPETPPLSEVLSDWLLIRCAMAARHLLGTEGPEHWRLLRELCSQVSELRRIDNDTERLELERKRAFADEFHAELKLKNHLEIGMKALCQYVDRYPEMLEAFRSIVGHMQQKAGFSLSPKDEEDLKELESE